MKLKRKKKGRVPSPEEIEALAREWLQVQSYTLWGRSFNIKEEPVDPAARWFTQQLESFGAFLLSKGMMR